MSKGVRLTGKVFFSRENDADLKEFQLEVEIDGNITRLQCNQPYDPTFFKKSDLDILVLESMPPKYRIECSCGNGYEFFDVNADFEKVDVKVRTAE